MAKYISHHYLAWSGQTILGIIFFGSFQHYSPLLTSMHISFCYKHMMIFHVSYIICLLWSSLSFRLDVMRCISGQGGVRGATLLKTVNNQKYITINIGYFISFKLFCRDSELIFLMFWISTSMLPGLLQPNFCHLLIKIFSRKFSDW